jgi:purine-nucleoside phosphorylase
LRLPYVKGRVWTTDAFYRETRDQVAARQKEGCIAVDMEVSGVQAVCDFHGFELYDFLVTGDILDAPVYENEGLQSANHDLDKLDIALEIAKRI